MGLVVHLPYTRFSVYRTRGLFFRGGVGHVWLVLHSTTASQHPSTRFEAGAAVYLRLGRNLCVRVLCTCLLLIFHHVLVLVQHDGQHRRRHAAEFNVDILLDHAFPKQSRSLGVDSRIRSDIRLLDDELGGVRFLPNWRCIRCTRPMARSHGSNGISPFQAESHFRHMCFTTSS